MKKYKICAILTALIMAVGMFSPVVSGVLAAENQNFISYKTGNSQGWIEQTYKILEDGSVQLGDGQQPAISTDTQGTVSIPSAITNYMAWETTQTYAVSAIGAKAFAGCQGIETIELEGDLIIDPQAFSGLNETTRFVTNSTQIKKALLKNGIALDRIEYQGLRSKYVAFGDSISAGYALPEYKAYPAGQEMLNDRYPTPSAAFVYKIAENFAANKETSPAITDNQSVSGWTSEQLLNHLERGDYKATLANASVVTVTIGSNDLLGPFTSILKEVVEKNFGKENSFVQTGDLEAFVTEINAEMVEDNEKGLLNTEVQAKRITLGQKIAQTLKDFNAAIQDNAVLTEACETFKTERQPAILKELHQQAPNAQIYWTTLYNPFCEQVFDMKNFFPKAFVIKYKAIFDTFETIDLDKYGNYYIEMMNTAFENAESQGYEAIDLFNVIDEAKYVNADFSKLDTFDADPHPNTDGHALIADVLRTAIAETYTPIDPAPDVSNEKVLKSFELAGKQAVIDQEKHTASLSVPYNTNLKDQAAAFTLSQGAQAQIAGTPQKSGATSNDFTNPVIYTIIAEDETTQDYTVTVTKEAAPLNPDNKGQSGNIEKTNATSVKTGIDTNPGMMAVILTVLALGMLGIYKVKKN